MLLRKNRFGGSKTIDPKLFAIILFHHFFQERYTFFQRVFIAAHQFLFLFFLEKLKQGWDKTAWT